MKHTQNEPIKIQLEEADDDKSTLHVSPFRIESILVAIDDRCFEFLNETVNELQFGGVVEVLMEEIRKKTDEKLTTCDKRITEETQSLYLNLTSTNPADWSKVGHSSRKILKFLADSLYKPSDEKYTATDGRILDVNESCYNNRLYAFLDMTVSSDEKKFMGAQLAYLDS